MSSITFRTLLASLCVMAGTACLPDGPPSCEAGDEPSGPLFAAQEGAGGGSCEPPPPCEDCGEGNGDPHVRTFDGLKFDFHTAAEVVAARAPDGAFEIQWRQQQLGASNIAGISAAAMSIDGTRVTVVGNSELRIDGSVVEIEDGAAVRLPTGVTVHRDGNKLMVVSADRDGAVHVNRHRAAMGVLVDPPDQHRGSMEGVLGDADGDPSNDVVLLDGTELAEPTWDDVHPELGEAWRVTDGITLFDYAAGEGPDTYWDPTFPQREPTLDDFTPEERAAAEATCLAAGVTDADLLADCIFDVLVMGDASYAELAALQQLARGRELDPGRGGPRPVAGPGEPSIRWDTPLEGYRLHSRQEEIVVDGDGHALIQVIRDDDGRHELVALDLADGSVAWTAVDVDATCTPVVDPGGFIFAQLVARSNTGGADNNNADVVALDPATGELVPGMRYTSPETDTVPRLTACQDRLHLGPDGQVVLIEDGITLWSLSTDAGAITMAWQRTYPVSQHRTPPAISSDGSAVYVGYVSSDDPLALAVERIDLQTGETTGSSGDLGTAFTTRPVADEAGLLLGVRLSGSTGRGPEALIRLSDDGTGLDEDWRVVFDSANPFTVGDEEFRENFGFTTFSVTVDSIVGYARGRILALDRSTGEPLWVHGAAGTNNHDRQAVDDAGTIYHSSFGDYWMRSVTSGEVDWELGRESMGAGSRLREAARIGPVIEGVLLTAAIDEEGVLHAVALDLPGVP